MKNQELVDFIKQQLEKGLTKEIITNQFLSSNWTLQEVEQGFKVIEQPAQNIDGIGKKKNKKVGIVLIVVSLFVVLLGGSLVYFLNNPQKISNINNIFSGNENADLIDEDYLKVITEEESSETKEIEVGEIDYSDAGGEYNDSTSLGSDCIDCLSLEELRILEEAGVDNTSAYEEAVFADGTNMIEWSLRNNFQSNIGFKLSFWVSKDCKVKMDSCDGFVDCVDKDFEIKNDFSCSALPNFSCYKKEEVRCEKLESGICGWKNLNIITSCLNK